jgi:heat shock protein HslJ/uncharacterized lipoprotein NlpE involved in copper resistance
MPTMLVVLGLLAWQPASADTNAGEESARSVVLEQVAPPTNTEDDDTNQDQLAASEGAHGLRLPATFKGDLPCADCAGIRHHLNLFPNEVFALSRRWLGKQHSRDEIGRWHVDPERPVLVLESGRQDRLAFQILSGDRLRMLDLDGRPIISDLPYELTASVEPEPLDLHLVMRGMFLYLADAALFTECVSGRVFPVAMEGAYRRLEEAYLKGRPEPGAPLMASFEGSIAQRPRMEGGGTAWTVVVERFINVWPGETCERNRTDATLANTYWRLVKLGEEAVGTTPGRREPHLLLREDERRFSATVGCNQLIGAYEADDVSLRFHAAAATRMACPPPLGDLENRLLKALDVTAAWRIDGQFLELEDGDGRPKALLQAVYLP